MRTLDASSIILDVTKTSSNNKQGLSEGDQPQPLASADNPYLNLYYSLTETLIIIG